MKTLTFKLFACFIFAITLFGCAHPTSEKYAAFLQAYVGKPESSVIERFGAPSKTYQSGGNNYLTYSKSNYVLLDSDFGMTFTCDTTFTVNSGVVQKYSFNGNGCKSK